MNADDVTGAVLDPLIDAARQDSDQREALFRALLLEPLLMAFVSNPGTTPTVRLTGGAPTRLIEAPALKVPVVPLYTSAAALRTAARDRDYWPDGIERASVFERGALFPLLRGLPGALLQASEREALPLDAGELAALADRQTPLEYGAALKALAQKGRGREVAQRLARRPLYVLGHPHGGMMIFQGEIAVFLHLATAERFAMRLAATSGERGQHGLVLGAELFKQAWRGKLQLHVEPGPSAFRLRPNDLR